MESTKDNRLIQEITLQNILSFGPDTPPLPMHNLNILIGPNASGKSNLIECINLLRHSTTDMRTFIQAGGVTEWAWKGCDTAPSMIRADLMLPDIDRPVAHTLWLDACAPHIQFRSEIAYADGSDNGHIPEIADLTQAYANIAIYREWYFGRNATLRSPQSAEMRNDTLEEDFANLGLILQRLQANPLAKQAILESLQDLYDSVTDYHVEISEGHVHVSFTEGDFDIPATRLSSGTLRYLCLLAILCDPTPPALICIDEPELSLHPDVLPKIADLLIEASQRTQLIVTTHSDILLDAMTEQPECVVVCDKHDGRTVMKRLSHAELAHWLEDFRLGELWTRGELGGTRW